MRSGVTRICSSLTALAVTAAVLVPAHVAQAAPTSDSFYRYTGSRALSSYSPGTVLKTRTIAYHLSAVPLPLTVVQILYRTTDAQGRASANVTSVIKAPLATSTNVVAYQSFYDSLNPEDSPSRAIAGGTSGGATISNVETALIVPFLLQGEGVVIADTEGATADFAAGPEYGRTTLDSIRAASNAAAGTGIGRTAKVGLIGYSGGAIATNWAAALAPSYAPDVERRLVGAAEGGVLVDPAHNLNYIQGSAVWAGVLVMALIGASRAYGISLAPYLNSYGRSLLTKLDDAPISSVLAAYPGLTWDQIRAPQYPKPEGIPVYRTIVNKLNLGVQASPKVPMFIGQGANGTLEGTSGSTPGIGAGDGVMITGDVRSLARQYCASGTTVSYRQYDLTSHFTTVPLWAPQALAWLAARFAGLPAPSSCGSIPAGNPLTPLR